ncbi:MAG: carbohydrate kinase, partial [Chitinispirillaceae bacterium]|nr:carbohydrate kinase [Chitinispirillaceae bacterium]
MHATGYLLGYDIGSSSIKATLLDIETGLPVATATSPATEMAISADQTGWAEQRPESWWDNVINATGSLRAASGVNLRDVRAIGISYQ